VSPSQPIIVTFIRRLANRSHHRGLGVQDDHTSFSVLRGALPKPEIELIRRAADAFYTIAEAKDRPFPRAYLYNPGNMAVSMAALDDFGTADYLLLRIVANSIAAERLRHCLGDDLLCSLTHSRMRKSYPQSVPDLPRPSTVAWHSDSDPDVGYFSAYILWVPFTPCDDQFPGLEFRGTNGEPIRVDLEQGDALLFSAETVHRTADCPTSTQARYSCDMRFFRVADIPSRVHQKVAQEPLLSVRAFASPSW
jgi:hypothetical protein